MTTQPNLRAVAPSDYPRLLAWRNSPEVASHMYTDHSVTEAEHARWCAGAFTDPARRYWIVELDGKPVGLANLADIDPRAGRCSWAFYLADPAVRGRGLGIWIEHAVLAHVFDVLGLRKLWCEVLLDNDKVWRMHESVGFRREAYFRAHVVKSGVPRDAIGLGILAEEWANVREALAERVRAKGLEPACAPSLVITSIAPAA